MNLLFIWSFYIICSSISISAIYLAINDHIYLSCIVTCFSITFAYGYIKIINNMLRNNI